MTALQLRSYCSRYSWSIHYLAAQLGVTHNWISHLRNGTGQISPRIEKKIKLLAAGKYVRPPENLSPEKKKALESQIAPSISSLMEDLQNGIRYIY